MTTHLPDAGDLEKRLEDLVLSLPPHELESVRLSLNAGLLFMEGRIASYEAKCRLESAALAAGFRVHNSLRVTPAIASYPVSSAADPASWNLF